MYYFYGQPVSLPAMQCYPAVNLEEGLGSSPRLSVGAVAALCSGSLEGAGPQEGPSCE